jgi:hypothetical protein
MIKAAGNLLLAAFFTATPLLQVVEFFIFKKIYKRTF